MKSTLLRRRLSGRLTGAVMSATGMQVCLMVLCSPHQYTHLSFSELPHLLSVLQQRCRVACKSQAPVLAGLKGAVLV